MTPFWLALLGNQSINATSQLYLSGSIHSIVPASAAAIAGQTS